jgi:hypothetical protein
MEPLPFPLSSREVVTFLIFLAFGTLNENVFQNSHKTVILRVCDFISFLKNHAMKTKGLIVSKTRKSQ